MVYSSETRNDNSKDSQMIDGDKKENAHIWEHPWSTSEIRKNSGNWTLAGDVGLLNHLQDFSHKLISKTHEMEKVVDALVHKSKVASAKVNNVINDFQMLSNLQFVENRVYDEEVHEPSPVEPKEVQPKTKEQREAEMLPRVKQALELGISVLDKAFERIDVEETSESEDEDEDAVSQGHTILEPKDLYEHRPLPYIIGTAEFQKDDYAGLQSLVDDEISAESAQGEDISSSSAESEESEEEEEEEKMEREISVVRPAATAEQYKNKVPHVDTMNAKYSDSESSDLFDMAGEENGYVSSSPTEDEEKRPETSNNRNPLMEELMKKAKAPSSDVGKSESIQSSVVEQNKKESDDLFASGDSLFEDEDSPFRKKSGLFSADGIFGSEKEKTYGGSDGEEDDLFSEQPVSTEKKPTPVSKVQVLPSPISKARTSQAEQPTPKHETGSTGSRTGRQPTLFDDDDIDDGEGDSLFGSFPAKSSSAKFSPISNSEVSATASNKSDKSTPSPSVSEKSNKSGLKLSHEINRPVSLFLDDSDSEDLFATTKSKVTKNTNLKTSDFSVGSAADDGEDDDLFNSRIPKKHKEPAEKKNAAPKEDKPLTKASISLFEESDSFDLFQPVKSQNAKEVPKSETKVQERVQSEKNVFEESDSFDLFSEVEKKDAKLSSVKTVSKTSEVQEPKHKTLREEDVEKPLLISTLTDSNRAVDDIESISFDKPLATRNTLTALNKDRVRIQVKRKKPTRKGRHSRISSELDLENSEEIQVTEDAQKLDSDVDLFAKTEESTHPISAVPSLDKPQSIRKQRETDRKNLMSQLMQEAQSSKILRQNVSNEQENDEGSDDLFSSEIIGGSSKFGTEFSVVSPVAKEPEELLANASIAMGGPKPEPGSLLLSDSTSDEDLFSASAFKDFSNSLSKNSILDDDDDDIFKSTENRDNLSRHSSEVLGDASDDIFAGIQKEKYEMFPTQVFDDDSDDDDIFSSAVTPKKDTPKEKSEPQKKKTKGDIFDDPLGGLALND